MPPVKEAHTPTKLQNTKWTKIMFFFENNNKDQVPIVTVIVGSHNYDHNYFLVAV